MTHPLIYTPDPALDLVLERVVDVPRHLVWKAWTVPEHLMPWFCPLPWRTVECEIDLRPGGIFRTVMQSPEGEKFPSAGCYLEVFENERLTWTDVLEPGFRPARPATGNTKECDTFGFTGVISLADHGKGTKYTAMAIHRSEGDRKRHEEMGFHQGWGTALDQLVQMIRAGA